MAETPTKLTHGNGEVGATCSSDSRSVVYAKGEPEVPAGKNCVESVPMDGGEPVPSTTTPASGADISPDGNLIATWY